MNIPTLESFIFEKMSSTRLPGLSIALVRDGQVVYARGFGLADIAAGRAATPETIFGAASVTKSFIAIAVLQLAEKGLLKLDDPVDRFVPWPIKSDKGTVRIEHLLAHTSGTPALGYIEAVLRHAHGIGGCWLPVGGPRDIPAFMAGAESWNETAPGERWFYLNEGYVLLGEIIEKITGLRYEQYVKQHVLDPLDMTRSFFAESDIARDGQLAVPYVLPKEADPKPGRYLYNVMGGDAALFTNVLDLARYVTMFMNRGRGVMSESSYESMVRPRVSLPAQPMPQLLGKPDSAAKPGGYGLGVIVSDNFLGEPLIGHTGSLIVSTSYIAYMPKSRVGVALLCNGNGYGMANLGKVALATMLGKDPQQELGFLRVDKALKDLTGHYETFRGTLKTKITKAGDFLRMEWLCGPQSPAANTLVPERLDGSEPRFFTITDGAKLPVQFRHVPGGAVELIYERYKFKRTAPLA